MKQFFFLNTVNKNLCHLFFLTPNHTILSSSSTQQLSLENGTNSAQQCIQSSCSAGGLQSSTSLEASTPPMPDMLPTPGAIALLVGYFSDPMEKKHLYSFYTCCGKYSEKGKGRELICSNTHGSVTEQVNINEKYGIL